MEDQTTMTRRPAGNPEPPLLEEVSGRTSWPSGGGHVLFLFVIAVFAP